ncbi:hypothetical protein [Lysinibacillus fusiformis]
MTKTQITIEPMQAKYNSRVGQLLVHGFSRYARQSGSSEVWERS